MLLDTGRCPLGTRVRLMTAPVPPPCPCGEAHEMTSQVREAYENVTLGLPPAVKVTAGQRAWLVPRIFIAVHGLKAGELPGLAERYGFPEAGT